MGTLTERTVLMGAAFLAAMQIAAGPAAADPIADFYKGKNVSLIIASSPAGMYAAYGRTLARSMTKHIPGNPNIVVKAKPGAGGIVGANHLYNIAPKDGSVMSVIPGTILFEPLFGNKKAKFDATKFNWIGNMDETVGLCGVWNTTGVTKFEDLLANKSVVFGGSSATSATVQHANALRNIYGAKIQVTKGYRGRQLKLALERGEVSGRCGLALSMLKVQFADHYKAGRLKLILQLARKKSPELPNVRHIYDYAKTKGDRQLLDIVFARQEIGRAVAGPPGLPANKAKALRAAFMATVKDPQFLSESKKQSLIITPSTGQHVEALIRKFSSYPKPVIAKAAKVMKGGKKRKKKGGKKKKKS